MAVCQQGAAVEGELCRAAYIRVDRVPGPVMPPLALVEELADHETDQWVNPAAGLNAIPERIQSLCEEVHVGPDDHGGSVPVPCPAECPRPGRLVLVEAEEPRAEMPEVAAEDGPDCADQLAKHMPHRL